MTIKEMLKIYWITNSEEIKKQVRELAKVEYITINTGHDVLKAWDYEFWIYYYDYTDDWQVGHDAWAYATSVEMYGPDGFVTDAVAWCSVNDVYNKKHGAQIALDRILTQIDEQAFVSAVWKEFDKLYE